MDLYEGQAPDRVQFTEHRLEFGSILLCPTKLRDQAKVQVFFLASMGFHGPSSFLVVQEDTVVAQVQSTRQTSYTLVSPGYLSVTWILPARLMDLCSKPTGTDSSYTC